MAHSMQNGRFAYKCLKKKLVKKQILELSALKVQNLYRRYRALESTFYQFFFHESIEQVNTLGSIWREGSSTFGWPAGAIRSCTMKKCSAASFFKNELWCLGKWVSDCNFFSLNYKWTSWSTKSARTFSSNTSERIDLLYRFIKEKLVKSWF